MSDEEPVRLDAPNQQVVRPDGSAPWDEGSGGSDAGGGGEEPVPLEQMTKAQLLELAETRGVDANDSMTKAEIVEALEG